MRFTGLQYALAWIAVVLAGGCVIASGQVLTLIPNCGPAGAQVCISGSGWAEPLPYCHYAFYFDGTTVAPNQADGLYGPPHTFFTVPAAAAGNHDVHVELRLESTTALLQEQDAPFLVVTPNTADSATTSSAGGSSIALTYTPANPSCQSSCKQILWIQVVQRFARVTGQTDAQAMITSATDWSSLPDAAKKALDETPAPNRARVDRIWGRSYPYYGVDNTGIPAMGQQNNGMTITVGATGVPPTADSMLDAPNTPASSFPTTLGGAAVSIDKAILRFESAPFCIAGDNIGTYLGHVVTWEFHQLATQVSGTVMNVAVTSGQPSAKYTAAVAQWITGNPPGTGTNRLAFNLPQPAAVLCY